MSRVALRGLVLVVSAVFALGVLAAPREREPRGRESPVVKMMKRVKALGDLITVPTPAPKP